MAFSTTSLIFFAVVALSFSFFVLEELSFFKEPALKRVIRGYYLGDIPLPNVEGATKLPPPELPAEYSFLNNPSNVCDYYRIYCYVVIIVVFAVVFFFVLCSCVRYCRPTVAPVANATPVQGFQLQVIQA